MFHWRVSSKFLNLAVVMIWAAGPPRVSSPSLTPHPDGIVSIFHPRQPTVEWPSNRRRQPAARSAAVSVLRATGPLVAPACWARLGRGAAIKAGSSAKRITGFTSPPRSGRKWGVNSTLRQGAPEVARLPRLLVGNTGQLLETRLHRATSTLAPGNHEDGVVARDRSDDFRPPRGVDGETEALGAAGGRLHHQPPARPPPRPRPRGEAAAQNAA